MIITTIPIYYNKTQIQQRDKFFRNIISTSYKINDLFHNEMNNQIIYFSSKKITPPLNLVIIKSLSQIIDNYNNQINNSKITDEEINNFYTILELINKNVKDKQQKIILLKKLVIPNKDIINFSNNNLFDSEFEDLLNDKYSGEAFNTSYFFSTNNQKKPLTKYSTTELTHRIMLSLIPSNHLNQPLVNNLLRIEDSIIKINALVLLNIPFADETKAFINTNFFKNLNSLNNASNIDIYFPLSINHINFILSKKIYDLVFFAGHGLKNTIIFSNNFKLNTENVLDLDFSNLAKNSFITLQSCLTGSINGIGDCIAKQSKKTVFAPTSYSFALPLCNIINIQTLVPINPNPYQKPKILSYNYTFLNQFQQNITRIIIPPPDNQ